MMLHQEFEPPEEYKDAIKCFWYHSRESGDMESKFEVIPDGYAEIIFYFGNLSGINHDTSLRPLSSPFMMGLLNQPAIFSTNQRLEIIGIRCYPWTVFDLLELQPDKNGICTFEHPIAQLHSILSTFIQNGNIIAAISEVKQYFQNRHPQVTVDHTLFRAGNAMRQANGSMPVRRVAAAAHATIRTLERKFKQSSGHTMKDISGLMRFEQVRNQIWGCPEVNLAGLAQELGYTDQSHLSKEFKRYSGTTPAAFARKAKQGKHITDTNFVAFVQA